MKTLSMLALLISNTALAQTIPNADFENWNFNGWGYNPDGWTTGNTQILEPVTRVDDAYSGQYAMQVEAVAAPLGQYGEASTTFLTSFIQANLNFVVKTNISFGGVQVNVIYYNDGNEVVNYTWSTSENLTEWTPVTMDFIQIEPIITDAKITVSAIVGDFVAGTAIIQIDSLYFDQVLVTPEQDGNSIVKLFPNPASEFFQVDGIAETGIATIYNSLGAVVKKQKLGVNEQIDISQMPSGIYFVEIQSGHIKTKEKLVISH